MIILIFTLASHQKAGPRYDGVRLSGKGDKVAVIELIGPIYSARDIVRQFKKYGKNKSVKAILFRIESPGGGISPSQEIYEAVKRVREDGKPVVASMGSVAASGGYYVALGADTIIANPGSTTGSIGVILEITNLRELFQKVGIKFEVIKTGRFKDTGSPHRDLTPADRRFLQNFVDDAYEQFIDVVAEERNMKKWQVKRLADGRVFTGRQAKEEGLIDLLGDFEDAVDLAASMGGIDGEPTLVREYQRHRSIFDLLFEELTNVIHGMGGPHLEYRSLID
ncbi:signal peptide peptidase SppA [bacterium]|nr:signal peptide peptidase SppA [bacterium]